ncbi:MAG TPA: type II toxin-antitoxin system HigB family toxin [Myxococcaceae bacterium]|nr:type II toxin-antitoxin system HigB family toxin [Myxococcaceae bacterium]
MRVIARKTLKDFWERPGRESAKAALQAWFQEARKARWLRPTDVKAQYRSADVLKEGRVVFNVGGNKYRLIAKINYSVGIVYVCFVGTHKEYDAIDAQTVRLY